MNVTETMAVARNTMDTDVASLVKQKKMDEAYLLGIQENPKKGTAFQVSIRSIR